MNDAIVDVIYDKPWVFTWDTSDCKNGSHIIVVKVYEYSGRSEAVGVIVYVNSKIIPQTDPDTTTNNLGSFFSMFLIGILGTEVIILVLLIRKVRDRKQNN